ncbi:MAG TPA: transposase [Verrucomicrobiae bacterium]
MASTYLSLHYHLVFSTKNREAFITPAWRARLHDYLGGTIRGMGGFPEGIGGVADHVHLLVGLKATHRLMAGNPPGSSHVTPGQKGIPAGCQPLAGG